MQLYRLIMIGIVLVSGSILSGCQTTPERDPSFATTRPVAFPASQPRNGAIYQVGHDIRLYEDNRARRVGDIITIVLNENTNASKTATTEIDKNNSNSITNPTILGTTPQFNAPGILPLATNSDNNLAFSLESENQFEGDANSSQSNNLTGNIAVTIAEVLPNGNLVVRGEKVLTLNQGHEYIRVSGIVRPADVNSNNTVLSTQIADAVISYNGTGPVAESNVMPWLAKFFISALFPF